jgi:hypothetical protein
MMDGESAFLKKSSRDGLKFSPTGFNTQITTKDGYRSNSIYGKKIGGSGSGSSRIPSSRGWAVGVVESKPWTLRILGTPTARGKNWSRDSGGGRRGAGCRRAVPGIEERPIPPEEDDEHGGVTGARVPWRVPR